MGKKTANITERSSNGIALFEVCVQDLKNAVMNGMLKHYMTVY